MASIYDIHIHPDPPTLWESSQPFARLLWSQLNTEGQGGEEWEIVVGGGGSSNLHRICQEMAAEDGRNEGGNKMLIPPTQDQLPGRRGSCPVAPASPWWPLVLSPGDPRLQEPVSLTWICAD